MCSIESTSPGREVAPGAVALVVAVGEAGEGCEAGFWAIALKRTRPRQSAKTLTMSFLMVDNLTRFHRCGKPWIFNAPRGRDSRALLHRDAGVSTTEGSADCSKIEGAHAPLR